tara:strand:- start:3459 stop:3641 length:183 start_codon:yes stop_codon:yes gene_type:complete
MQLKFNQRKTIGQSLISKLIKVVIICLFFTLAIFLLEKFNFPSPKQNIKKDITNEIIKLK